MLCKETSPDNILSINFTINNYFPSSGQRHFLAGRNGLLLHQKSPAEFTRGSITDEARYAGTTGQAVVD